MHVGVEDIIAAFHNVGKFDLADDQGTKRSKYVTFLFELFFIVLAQIGSFEFDIVGIGFGVVGVQIFVLFIDLRMGIFVSGPNDSDRPFKGEDIVLILCDFDIAVEYVCLAANEGNIWIVLLFGIA